MTRDRSKASSEWPFEVRRLWLWLGILVVGTASTVARVSVSQTVPRGLAPPVAISEPNEEAVNSSRSLMVERDRLTEGRFRSVKQAIRQEQFGQAAEVLQEILNTFPRTVVLVNGVLRGSAELAREIIHGLPAAGRAAYTRHSRQQSGDEFRQAVRKSDLDALLNVASRFSFAPGGTQALRAYAAAQIDRGAPFASALAISAIHRLSDSRSVPSVDPFSNIHEQFHDRPASAVPPVRFPDFGAENAWTHDTLLSSNWSGYYRRELTDLRENGLTPWLTLSAVPIPGGIVVSTPFGVLALDSHDGQILWSRMPPSRPSRIPIRHTLSRRSLDQSRNVLHSVFGESVFRSLASDSDRVYVVERVQQDISRRNRSLRDNEFPASALICLDAQSGRRRWEFHGARLGPCFFAGPPLVLDKSLFVLIESQVTDHFELIRLRTTDGSLLSRLPLGKSLVPFPEDFRRHESACPLVSSAGQLLCPTTAGALFAVDPLWDEISWVYRHPRNDSPDNASDDARDPQRKIGYRWWSGWQGVQTISTPDRIIYVTPESDELACLDRWTGRLIWSVPRGQSRFVAVADETHGVVLVGDRFAQALDLQTGKPHWHSPIERPAGRGVRNGEYYVFPTGSSDFLQLSLTTGQTAPYGWRLTTLLEPQAQPSLVVPRNLIRVGSDGLEVSATGVRYWRDAPGEDVTGVPELTSETDSLFNLIRADGLIESYLHATIASEAKRLAEVVETLLGDDRNRAIWHSVRIERAIREHDWLNLVELWLGEDCPEEVWQTPLDQPDEALQTRLDRWVLGRVEDELKIVDSALADQLVAEAVSFLANLNNRQTASASRRVAGWGRAFGHRFPGEVDATHSSAEIATELPTGPSPMEDAASDWPQMAPRVIVHSSRGSDRYSTVPVSVHADSPLAGVNVEVSWPAPYEVRFQSAMWDVPRVCSLPRSNRYFHAEPDLVQGWGIGDLLVLQLGSELFGIDPFETIGDSPIEIDQVSELKVEEDGDEELEPPEPIVRRVRLVWPPYDSLIDTLGDRPNGMLLVSQQPRPVQSGFFSSEVERIDEFGHRPLAIGPVREEYVCIQQKGMLVLIDPLTGQELWRRYDLPERAHCFGNESRLIVVSQQSGQGRILRVVDGREEASAPIDSEQSAPRASKPGAVARRSLVPYACPVDLDDIILVDGTDVMTVRSDADNMETGEISSARRGTPLIIARTDLLSGRQQWEREWPPFSIPFPFDERHFGVAQQTTLDLIDRTNGQTWRSHSLATEERLTHVRVSSGAQSVLIVTSSEVDDQRLLHAPQRNRGFRHPLVNGHLLAVRRDSGDLIWDREFPNTAFPLDQPIGYPIFITSELRLPESQMDSGAPGSLLRCYDRRTGNLLYETESTSPTGAVYTVSGNRKQRLVTLTTPSSQVELHYSPPPLDEAPSAQQAGDHSDSQPLGADESGTRPRVP